MLWFHLTVFLVFVLWNHLVYNSGINSCKYQSLYTGLYSSGVLIQLVFVSGYIWFGFIEAEPRMRVWPLHFFSGGHVGSTVPITERMWRRHLSVDSSVAATRLVRPGQTLCAYVCVCERVCWGVPLPLKLNWVLITEENNAYILWSLRRLKQKNT